MKDPVRRDFVSVNGRWGTRQVHYHHAGSGPLLLIMHQSPQSSRECTPIIETLCDRFTVVAPDMPGYGLSDPLGVSNASLFDFADATIEFVDAIGGKRFSAYGFHTGGMVAVAMSDKYPERIVASACNGIAVPTDDERDEILANYFPPFVPRWDGGHLAWLWARMREQTIFFPWYRRELSARMEFPVSPPERLQAGALELLRAAQHYAVAYEAAFRFPVNEVLARLEVPVVITAAAWDPLLAHLSRIESPAAIVDIAASGAPDEAQDFCLDHISSHPGDPLKAPTALALVGGLSNVFIHRPRGSLRVRLNGDAGKSPVICLHGPGSSSIGMERVIAGLADQFRIIAVDLPGHGESSYACDADGPTTDDCIDAVSEVLDELGIQRFSLLGFDGGAFVAAGLASRREDRVDRIVLVNAPILSVDQRDVIRERGLPSLAPDWHGGHLSRAWHMVRDGRLFSPWFRRDPDGILWREPDLDEAQLQLEVTELLKSEGAWQNLLRDQLTEDLLTLLGDTPGTIRLCAVSPGASHDVAKHEAESRRLDFHSLPHDPADWPEVLAACLSR